jgi:anti-sigma regulatory factor (Ser/Thr protein kinase)
MTPPASPGPGRSVPGAPRWDASDPPSVSAGGYRWQLSDPRQLSAVRRDARGLLARGADGVPRRSDDALDEAAERIVLALDELASNALRHGGPPVSVELFDRGATWLIVATDSAISDLPVPAVGRPGGLGGFGLYVVADFAIAHGIELGPDFKKVWAELRKE